MYNADKMYSKDAADHCKAWLHTYITDDDKTSRDHKIRVLTVLGFWETRYLNGCVNYV